MTNDIVKIKSVAASQGGETEHGLMLDSSILSYTYHGSSKTVKWILDTIFTLLGGKAASATTLAGYGITDAYTKTQVDSALAGKAEMVHMHTFTDIAKNGTTLDATIAGIDTALAGKADSDHSHTSIEAGEVDITCQQTTSGGNVVITIGDDNIQLIGADLVKLRTLLDS